jgi:isoaspartyl peptidase/L-asparaginase-like protein (Ntn-hydrolase superfamily)
MSRESSPPRPAVVIHAGAGARRPEIDERQDEYTAALLTTVDRARAVLARGGSAVDAAQAAVMFMEDGVEFFNAGRGAALCSDGSAELSAAIMSGPDRAAGAVAGIKRTRYPIRAARAVLDRSPHVLLAGAAADEFAAGAGAEQRDPAYFVTERQRRRLASEPPRFERGTVGAVCLDAKGNLAAATSTGGMRGQLPGRIGDSPVFGAGTWADDRVAISCTGDGEAFVRAGAARLLALLVSRGEPLGKAADRTLDEVATLGGHGGLIALDSDGAFAMPFHPGAMPRGVWCEGEQATVWA